MPPVGTWIEINLSSSLEMTTESCPPWARGLKFGVVKVDNVTIVVPPVGTWIEIRLAEI